MSTSTIVGYSLVWDANRRCVISTREGVLLDLEVTDAGKSKETFKLYFLEPNDSRAIVSARQFALILPGETIDTTLSVGKTMGRSGYWRTIPTTKWGKAYLFEFPLALT